MMSKIGINPANSIPGFYTEQSIFLTGATGFVGKVFVEKVLRSCPDIREIFLLIRPSNKISTVEKFEKMLRSPLFDRLRDERPSSFNKLIPISGDSSEEGLGLLPADRQTLIERVTIVVHNSASVKFNDTIKYAIFVNTRSTRDICVLAESMKNLKALVYVSTAYAQTNCHVVEEKVYPPKANWRKLIKIVESLDDHSLNIFTSKYMDNAVNTYVFSKNLAEGVIQDYSTSLPCAILRLSMVMPAISEPYPGWTDSVNGPLGLYILGGKGISHVVYCGRNVCHDWIPVDVVAKSLLQVIWKRGVTTVMPDTAPLVFNCSSSNEHKMSQQTNIKLAASNVREIPFENIVWAIDTVTLDNHIVFYILFMLWQVFPALLMDFILKCFNRKPMLFKLQKKLYVTNWAIKYFSFNEWTFDNTNTMALNETVPPDNEKEFKFHLKVDQYDYLRSALLSMKKFFFNEDMSQAGLSAAKAHSRRVHLLAAAFKTCVIVGTLWAIYHRKIYSFFLLFHLIYTFHLTMS
ncbi:PREDICTED: fatty acyl-CoA reductase 1-like [Vollenhovia emeryi]|uniref:fatty acyl-CoA reductase 1-like n=1 Tax=Vollenhovia emeryi TaxID=411798 RepID=UPI0005F53BF7|nr:PREDICTED: fatty acyl-CoA reductase 1-like [Vollenhovia emeryi]